jgi:hypothetical protein
MLKSKKKAPVSYPGQIWVKLFLSFSAFFPCTLSLSASLLYFFVELTIH